MTKAYKNLLAQLDKQLNALKGKVDEQVRNTESISERIESAMTKDEESRPVKITSIIERLELIEEKMGVRFDGIYGVQVKRTWENPVDFLIKVHFDVVGTEEILREHVYLKLSAYNSAGQLLNTTDCIIDKNNFMGIDSKKLEFICLEAPIRLRLYPSKAS